MCAVFAASLRRPALTKSWSLDSSWINNGGTCCGCVSGNDLGASVAATDKDVCAEQGGLVELVTEELSGLVDTNPACVSEKAPNEHAVEMFSKLGASYIARVDEQSSNFIGLVTRKDLSRFLDSLFQAYKQARSTTRYEKCFCGSCMYKKDLLSAVLGPEEDSPCGARRTWPQPRIAVSSYCHQPITDS